MKSVYDFIVRPVGDRYNNVKKINNKDLVLNTKIESWKFVNRIAEVVSTPLAFNTPIKKGDTVVVHQNVFRRFYNMKGEQANSRSFFKDDLYFAASDQIYLYKQEKWRSFGDRCFVKPIENNNSLFNDKMLKGIGVLKIGNNTLDASHINLEDVVGFKLGAEWEFLIDNELLYCMKSNDIILKYGYKENQKEYNPSWANSS